MDYFTDEFLGFLELKQDMLFHKIPKELIVSYINTSLEIGFECASKQRTNEIFSLYKKNNIQVKEELHGGVFFKVQMRAEFEADRKGNNIVYLYEQSIKQISKENKISVQEMKKVILAHEFFHYLEENGEGNVSERLPKIESAKILGLTRKAGIRRTSEIAAYAFAKQLLNLEYLPNYFDYQYLLKVNQLKLDDIKEEFEQYERLKNK